VRAGIAATPRISKGEPRHSGELADVVGDEREIGGKCVSGDQIVVPTGLVAPQRRPLSQEILPLTATTQQADRAASAAWSARR
jgi:hypothetical protein